MPFIVESLTSVKYYKDKECTIVHREDGPAVEFKNGTEWWLFNNLFHRADGPAIEFKNGTEWWLFNNLFHRADGPAIITYCGNKYFYIHGNQYEEEDYWAIIKLGAFV